jgi:hypothetical protein
LPGGVGWHVEMTALKQVVPWTQSASDAQGKAHLPYSRLQRWLMHIESFVQGDAAGPGMASVPGAAGGASAVGAEPAAPGTGGVGLAGGAEASRVPHAHTKSASRKSVAAWRFMAIAGTYGYPPRLECVNDSA